MKAWTGRKALLCLLLIFAVAFSCAACAPRAGEPVARLNTVKDGHSDYLISVEDQPDTVDFQCTTIHYTIATNVFNRLVETEGDENGGVRILPSLAQSWEVSDDGRSYTFHLRGNVRFSNGSPLTASDVQYTFTRLLTHPDACNRDIMDAVVGAAQLERGETDRLEGFEVLGDLDFRITLNERFEAFLACLSMPGASILDEETTREAGDRFGRDPAWTIGTGSFILKTWTPGKGMTLEANPSCWQGPPRCAGLDLRFLSDPQEIQRLFDGNQLDILDLDELGNAAEFFLHGDLYSDRLIQVRRLGIHYIALNQSVEPLNDVRVRKALQLALDRPLLLAAVSSGRGTVENGILPHGLYGFNPDLPEIPCDPEQARALLAEAGYPDGFDLTFSVSSASTQWETALVRLAASMWKKIGVRTTMEVLKDSEFMTLRKSGRLACYTALWTADYNDPDNFLYTFFGNSENTRFRSLCYPDQEIMDRVDRARTIADADARIAEYRELERIIVQEDAAWIPLFSRLRWYVTSERTGSFQPTWNGSVKNVYRDISITQTP